LDDIFSATVQEFALLNRILLAMRIE